jgi:hypothetical protein
MNALYIAPTSEEMVTLITCWPDRGPEKFKVSHHRARNPVWRQATMSRSPQYRRLECALIGGGNTDICSRIARIVRRRYLIERTK